MGIVIKTLSYVGVGFVGYVLGLGCSDSIREPQANEVNIERQVDKYQKKNLKDYEERLRGLEDRLDVLEEE